MKINQQNSPAKTQPIPLTDESMFELEDLTDEECFGIVGGSVISATSFHLNSYLFIIGTGATFNGGVTSNVVDIAFQKSLFTATFVL